MSVYFYLPNIVGYLRVVVLFLGLAIVFQRPFLGASVIGVSALMDALDGFLARRLNQSSKFGAILDYAIDRATIASICMLLALVYQNYWVLFAFMMSLDLIAHLFHLQASFFLGKASHKNMEGTEPFLLRLYYRNKFTLTMTCLCHDLFLGSLFLYHFDPNALLKISLALFFPGFLFKTGVHIVKIYRSSQILVTLS